MAAKDLPAGTIVALRPGLWRVGVPDPLQPPGTWAYVFVGDRHLGIIDPGFDSPAARRVWAAVIARVGRRTAMAPTVLVTHVHPERPSIAGWLARRLGGTWGLAAAEWHALRHVGTWTEADRVAWFGRLGLDPTTARAVAAGWMAGVTGLEAACPVALGTVRRMGADRLKGWWTPGHTPGHHVFVAVGRGEWFTGDLVLATVTPNVSWVPGGPADPLGAYLSALRTLRRLAPRTIYPAHGPVPDAAPTALRLLHHHATRLRTMLGLLTVPRTVAEVAEAVFGLGRRSAADQRRALGETLAHLEYAVRRGMAVRLLGGEPTPVTCRLETLPGDRGPLRYGRGPGGTPDGVADGDRNPRPEAAAPADHGR
ncbi:MAG: MBL fold metallo-hydrolase [Actinomycetia bacterium]|nr:MBL fold metallo-hydrolase [Actinomycetes bacterium]